MAEAIATYTSATRTSNNCEFRSSTAGTHQPSARPQKRNASVNKTATKSNSTGIAKPKQSKSRNGCVTCKAKRLKCDETKPGCQQCARRRVSCGGYQKNFKWRPLEEASFGGKPGKTGKPRGGNYSSLVTQTILPTQAASASPQTPSFPLLPQSTRPPDSNLQVTGRSVTDAYHNDRPLNLATSQDVRFDLGSLVNPIFSNPIQSFHQIVQSRPAAQFEPHAPPIPGGLQGSFLNQLDNSLDSPPLLPPSPSTAPSSSSGQSPRLIDLCLPGTILSRPPPRFSQANSIKDESARASLEQDEVEEVVQSTDVEIAPPVWSNVLPSPALSPVSAAMEPSQMQLTPTSSGLSLMEPEFATNSPEMLMLGFDRQTCGILSIKDGPTENPWRTLVWPLARHCSALFHAVASMTSFHVSKGQSHLRLHGIEHMRTAIQSLASGIEKMRTDAAIATTLALAFSESWDQHISTGIDHIRGARVLVNQAISTHRQSPFQGEDLARLKFLLNTWVYMDVIARLTSLSGDDSNDFELVSSFLEEDSRIDPLMGCAATLFPLIGRVANLVRRVRRSSTNSVEVSLQAAKLRTELENWTAPGFLEPVEDPTVHVQHSLQTAEAYRWATLLYLHQAVPEMRSMSSAELAKNALTCLANVPLTSRAVIVQIYPLIAAGSEVRDAEKRAWVCNRWQSMAQRMAIGVIDRCADVVKEVWRRRDAYEDECRKIASAHSNLSIGQPSFERVPSPANSSEEPGETGKWPVAAASVPPAPKMGYPSGMEEQLEHEFTVRGSLHWLGVMKDWKWEVLLG